MKIGIALGAGGAKGFAHVGVLKVLAEIGVECDIVVGTSMGALIGSAYAGGKIQELEEAACKIKLTDIPGILSPTWSKQGLCSGRGFLDHLEKILDVENIEDLKKTFAAVCVDLNKSEPFTFTKGAICQAVQASMAIPAIFKPVIFQGKLLVDGGVLDPVPVEATRSLGADFVIAVDLLTNAVDHFTSSEDEYAEAQESLGRDLMKSDEGSILDYLSSLLDKVPLLGNSGLKEKYILYQLSIMNIIRRTSEITQMGLMKYRLKEHPPDFLIQPELTHVGLLDLHYAKQAIESGEQATQAVISELTELINKHKNQA